MFRPHLAWLPRPVAVFVLASLLVGTGLATRAAANASSGERWASDRIFVKLRATTAGTAAKPSPALQRILGPGLAAARPMAHRAGPQPAGLDRLLCVPVPVTTNIPLLVADLARLPEVEYAEPVWIYELATARPGEAVPAAVPNDPNYPGMQAYLANLQVEAAWDVQKSEAGVPRPIVCIVDGGTNWQHEDLNANMWTNPGEIAGNGVDDDGNGHIDDIHGWNFGNNTGNPRGSTSAPGNANHGTHTAGLAAAVTNNGVGIAAASWNPFLMAVNASGGEGNIAYGYDGVVYAAENGADVVSLSWGGGGAGQAGQDVVDFATANGTLVIGAAGNGNTNKPFYPAAYRGVIAVANVQNNDTRYNGPSGSNYGGWVDVAAPGTSLYSTFDNNVTNSYGFSTGTSMSAPVAAGVAALIVAKHPTWGPLDVGEQLRISCDNINAVNPGYVDQLGRGRVNALRAVTDVSPAVRATAWTLADTNADGQLNQGENVVMSLTVHNYLAPAVSPSYALSTTSPWITITDAAQSGSTLMDDGEATLANAFAFSVNPNVPPGTTLDLRLDITATGYSDFQYIPIVLEPLFETHDVNDVQVSLTATGGVGYVGFPSGFGDDGDGFSFQGGPNVLFEGALLLGTSATHLSDAARGTNERTDFASVLKPAPYKLTPGPSGKQEIHGAFTDSLNVTTPLGVRVDLSSWASADPANSGFVIVSYEIRNRSGAAMDSLWAALWCDWDIDEDHYSTNRTAYDATRRLGYAWDNAPGLPYTGILALSGTTAGFSAIANGGPGGPVNLVDGFSKAEKWDILQGGTGVLSAGPTDISNALSSGPYRVATGGRALVVFALVGGTSLANLQANADRAREFFADSVLTDAPPAARMAVAALGPATPNPFNPTTRFTLELRDARDAEVAIFDASGHRVKMLTSGRRAAGRTTVEWDGTDAAAHRVASGVYFARLRSGDIVQVRRLVLAK
jgi:subtilisin family serine protease